MASYRRRDRSGHDQHAPDPVRRRRADRRCRPARARADPPARRAGSSTTPREIWRRTREVIGGALASSRSGGRARSRRSASPTSARRPSCGTARRGEPIYNAIVWQDTRTAELVRELAGDGGRRSPARARRAAAVDLLLAARSSPGCSSTSPARARAPRAASWPSARSTAGCCGTSPAAPRGGVHATDVTNASRTMLMDLQTLDWHEPSLELMGIPRCDAARDPLLERGLRRGARHRARRAPGRGDPRRPAGRAVRTELLRARRGEEHLRHRLLPARQHGRARSCTARSC